MGFLICFGFKFDDAVEVSRKLKSEPDRRSTMAPITASALDGKNKDIVAILDAGAQYGKVRSGYLAFEKNAYLFIFYHRLSTAACGNLTSNLTFCLWISPPMR